MVVWILDIMAMLVNRNLTFELKFFYFFFISSWIISFISLLFCSLVIIFFGCLGILFFSWLFLCFNLFLFIIIYSRFCINNVK